MGTCGSKCCSEPPSPSISDSESLHDKVVISSDPLPFTMPPPKDPSPESPINHSKFQVHPYPALPSSSSSSSSSSSFTTPTSSSISATTITTTSSYSTAASHTSSSYSTLNSSSSYATMNSSSSCSTMNSSSSYSTTTSSNSTENSSDSRANCSDLSRRPPKKKSFSNEFLLSCVENSNIVILDPSKAIKEKAIQDQFSLIPEIPITPSQYLSATTTGITTSSLRQRTNTATSMRINQSNNAKRARSASPASRTGRKVIKPDQGSWSPVSSNITRPRTGDLQLPQWRPANSQRGSSNALTGPASRPISAAKKDMNGPTMEKEANEKQLLMQDGEVVSREGVKTPPLVEDLNNPLIAMDCFIFL